MKGTQVITILLCFSLFASAAESRKFYKYIAEFNGVCTKAIYFNKDKTRLCRSKAVNIARIDNRIEFGFYLGRSITLIFSGGHDSQPELNKYILKVDRVRMLDKARSLGELPAKGECRLGGDIMKAATIHCYAIITGKKLNFKFRATSPAKLRH